MSGHGADVRPNAIGRLPGCPCGLTGPGDELMEARVAEIEPSCRYHGTERARHEASGAGSPAGLLPLFVVRAYAQRGVGVRRALAEADLARWLPGTSPAQRAALLHEDLFGEFVTDGDGGNPRVEYAVMDSTGECSVWVLPADRRTVVLARLVAAMHAVRCATILSAPVGGRPPYGRRVWAG